MIMNIRHLETMLWVIRLGGVGAAARHLNLTQPAVTRRIQELEENLGAPLFEREGRTIIPTALAKVCAANAERVLAEVSLMRITATGGAAVAGKIRAGVTELIALTWFDRLITRIQEAYPNLIVEIDVDLSSRLLTKLGRRQLDIVFVPGPISIPEAAKTYLGSCTFQWMANPQLLHARRELTPLDVAQLPIISLPHDADVHWTMVKWFEEAGVEPRRMSYCNSFSVIASLVRKGLGISLLPYELFRHEVDTGSLVVLPESPQIMKPEYSVAYIPSAEFYVLPQIAAFAKEESLFLNVNGSHWRL